MYEPALKHGPDPSATDFLKSPLPSSSNYCIEEVIQMPPRYAVNQSISHNVIKQGFTSIVGIGTSQGSVMRICITANDDVSSSSPAAHHQLLQFPWM